MTWLRNILFAAAVCMVVDAALAQEPVRKPDVVPGVRDLSPGSEPYSGGTSVSRKPFTTLPGEVRRQPDAIADTLMRRVASGISADGYPSALPRTGADFSRDIFFYDYSSGGDLMRWKGGALAGSGSRVTMPGLLSRQKASLQAVHTVGNLMLTAGVTADRYLLTRGLQTVYGVSASATYSFNEHLSLTVFGRFYNSSPFVSMAAMPYMGSSAYG